MTKNDLRTFSSKTVHLAKKVNFFDFQKNVFFGDFVNKICFLLSLPQCYSCLLPSGVVGDK